MKKIVVGIFGLLLFCSCDIRPEKNITEIKWVQKYGYDESRVHSVTTGGVIPGAKIPITIEGQTHKCLIDLGTYDFVLSEEAYDLQKFEPFRLVNRQVSAREMLLEEGIVKQVRLLNMETEKIYAYLMKKSTPSGKFAGLVGWQFFENNLLTIDLDNKLVGIKKCSDIPADPIDFYTGDNPGLKNNMLKYRGTIQGRPITMSVSTSLRFSQISPEFLTLINHSATSAYVKIDSIQIGNQVLNNVNCRVNDQLVLLEPEGKDPIDFILGLNEIKQFVLSVNFCDQQFYLQSPTE